MKHADIILIKTKAHKIHILWKHELKAVKKKNHGRNEIYRKAALATHDCSLFNMVVDT